MNKGTSAARLRAAEGHLFPLRFRPFFSFALSENARTVTALMFVDHVDVAKVTWLPPNELLFGAGGEALLVKRAVANRKLDASVRFAADDSRGGVAKERFERLIVEAEFANHSAGLLKQRLRSPSEAERPRHVAAPIMVEGDGDLNEHEPSVWPSVSLPLFF